MVKKTFSLLVISFGLKQAPLASEEARRVSCLLYPFRRNT